MHDWLALMQTRKLRNQNSAWFWQPGVELILSVILNFNLAHTDCSLCWHEHIQWSRQIDQNVVCEKQWYLQYTKRIAGHPTVWGEKNSVFFTLNVWHQYNSWHSVSDALLPPAEMSYLAEILMFDGLLDLKWSDKIETLVCYCFVNTSDPMEDSITKSLGWRWGDSFYCLYKYYIKANGFCF